MLNRLQLIRLLSEKQQDTYLNLIKSKGLKVLDSDKALDRLIETLTQLTLTNKTEKGN